LSFAQFEREVIGERVRDKISASKRKGIWVGGPVPLGYAAIDKKAIVVPAEAETVRAIFTRYLELGSVRALAEDLAGRGIRTKQRQLKDGRIEAHRRLRQFEGAIERRGTEIIVAYSGSWMRLNLQHSL
jgi:site-specific DNA recombinase